MWVDLGWPSDAHQAISSLLFISGTGGENKTKNPMGQDKDNLTKKRKDHTWKQRGEKNCRISYVGRDPQETESNHNLT